MDSKYLNWELISQVIQIVLNVKLAVAILSTIKNNSVIRQKTKLYYIVSITEKKNITMN